MRTAGTRAPCAKRQQPPVVAADRGAPAVLAPSGGARAVAAGLGQGDGAPARNARRRRCRRSARAPPHCAGELAAAAPCSEQSQQPRARCAPSRPRTRPAAQASSPRSRRASASLRARPAAPPTAKPNARSRSAEQARDLDGLGRRTRPGRRAARTSWPRCRARCCARPGPRRRGSLPWRPGPRPPQRRSPRYVLPVAGRLVTGFGAKRLRAARSGDARRRVARRAGRRPGGGPRGLRRALSRATAGSSSSNTPVAGPAS